MNIQEATFWATKILSDCQIEQPDVSARILLEELMSVPRTYLITNIEQLLSSQQEKKFRSWVYRRSKHEPISYITGKVEFYDQEFRINNNVLIPRPETELLVERFIGDNKSIITKESQILEIGTGSGAIIITLASRLNGTFFASDISKKALQVAILNADKLECRTNILFKIGNLFEPWKKMKFDFIVANLPYISSQEILELSLDITEYEPKIALFGGKSGLEIYREFIIQAPSYLKEKGKIYCEIGEKQDSEMIKIIKQNFPKSKTELYKDYADITRIISIQNNH